MNFNTILSRFGLDPDDFINRANEPIHEGNIFIYEVDQKIKDRRCPFCGRENTIIKDHDTVEINCSQTDQIRDIVRVRKTRLYCKQCRRSFTLALSGIESYSRISGQTIDMICNDFFRMMTFRDIGIRYGLSTARIIQIFDEQIKYVPRKTMPFVLCIDEIKFEEEINQKYCCVLYDFDNRNIVDIIRNRQLPYLEEYFEKIPEKERNRVKYFVSDMYDAYRTVKRKYFPKALHVVDLFHVMSQLTRAVNQIRVKVMKSMNEDTMEYHFMKSHWKLFLTRKEDIPDKYFTSQKTGESKHYSDMVFRCVLKDNCFLEAWNALQDLYHYNQSFYTFNEALRFINDISDRLYLTGDPLMEAAANTYRKWAVEIANALSRSQAGRRFTNGIAESLNNHLKTIIKTAYGYHSFERFRKRAMMIITYKKDLE